MIQGSSLSLDRACCRACDVRTAQRLRAALLAFFSCHYRCSLELTSLSFFCGFVPLLGRGWFSEYLSSSRFSLGRQVFKRLCVVKKFVVQDVLGWRGSGSQVTGVDGCGSIVYGSFTFVLFCSFLAEIFVLYATIFLWRRGCFAKCCYGGGSFVFRET
jgi:hypothetical protein